MKTPMTNKQLLRSFVNKYSLCGRIENAVWNYNKETQIISVICMTDNRNVFSRISFKRSIECQKKEIPDVAEFGIDTHTILNAIRTLPDTFIIKLDGNILLKEEDGSSGCMFIEGGIEFYDPEGGTKKGTVDFLSPDKVDPVPTMKNIPPWTNSVYTLDSGYIKSLVSKLSDWKRNNNVYKPNDGLISIADEFEDTKGQYFDGFHLHKLFRANKDMDELVFRTSPKGLSYFKGESECFSVEYYLVKSEPDDDNRPANKILTKRKTHYEEMIEQKEQLTEYAKELNQLQSAIDENDALSIKHGKLTLELALKAGTILREVKKLVVYGQFEKWVEDNVKGITVRTAQNYMRLAQAYNIEQERIYSDKELLKTKYVSLFDDVQGLREAYLAARIIKKNKTGRQKDETPNTKTGPEYEKAKDEAKLKMVEYVRGEIDKQNQISWNLKDWRITRNGKPDDKGNYFAMFFEQLVKWICLNNHSELDKRDNICLKTNVVLSEIIKSFILANQPATITTPVDDYSLELTKTVEEKIAA